MMQCKSCLEWEDETEFHSDKSTKTGKKSYCKKCMSERRKKWNCHNKYYESAKQWGENKWRNKTKEEHKKIKDRRNKRQRERLKTDEQFIVHNRMSGAIRSLLRKRGIEKGNSTWLEFVDYDKEQLVSHLKESLDRLGKYSWSDFIQGKLHIDHIKPQSLFKFDSPHHPEFKKCWALSNLQLLPAEENIRKGAKYAV